MNDAIDASTLQNAVNIEVAELGGRAVGLDPDVGLDPHVPRVASHWDEDAPGSLWRPVVGSLVLVDISGFTNLSERLARRGRIGAEELTSVLDRVFGEMLEVVFARGGSLLKFGGDALLLLFETEDHVLQACAATVEMRSTLREASKQPTSVGRINLRMSSGIHTGAVDFFLVGHSHRELIVTGPTASVTTEMEKAAEAGEIVVSPAVRDKVPSGFVGERRGPGWLLRKQRVNHPPSGPVTKSPRSDEELAAFIPRGLREHLGSGISDSEHRVATVGFIQFRGVDSLLAGEGPERVGMQLDNLVRAVQDAADAEDVTFLASDTDSDGGKIILTAGVPASQHDDEGRMLRTARRVLDSEPALSVRIGVNRGHVFAGNVGARFRSTYTVMGDTVNLAARLMAAAGPGMLYTSPSVLGLSATLYRTEALEAFRVKGKEHPIQAYAVYEETGTRPPELASELPFRGRDSELEMIVGIVTTCARVGRGGMMTISGDIGVGKSRLIAEVLERCPGLATLMIKAEPNGSDNPYWAFRDPMRRMLQIERSDQDTMSERLRTVVEGLAPDLTWALPLLGQVLHIKIDDTDETAAIDARFRPDRTADVVIELLSASNNRPLAVIVEDGQWLDAASTALLRKIGDAAATRPWTIVITARRNSEGYDVLGDEIGLAPLDDESIRAIAIEVTAGAPLRLHELDTIVMRAGGNPLFLSEILKVIRETGSAEQIPESLDAVVSTEIDTLPPLVRQILRYSSVLGTSFRRTVLDEYLAPERIHLDKATEEELSHFIEPDGRSRLRFRHAVVHDVAYEGLSFHRRRELHARAGSVIERLAGDSTEAVAEFLAYHYSQSGDHGRVWRYARVAADKAKAAYANTEADSHYRRAIEAARHLDDVDPADVAHIWSRLGEVRDLSGQYEDARAAYGRALRLFSHDPIRAAELHLRRAEAWMGSGNLPQAKRNITLGRKEASEAEDLERVKTLARLAAYEASVHAADGDPANALNSSTSAIELAESSGEKEALARAYGVRDWANFVMGRNEPRDGEKAIDIFQSLGLLERSVGIMNNMGAFAYLEGKWDEAVAWYEDSLETAERSGNVFEAALTKANIAEVLVSQRKYTEARPLLDEAKRIYQASNATHYMPLVELQQSRAMIGLGDIEHAVEDLGSLLTGDLAGSDSAWAADAAKSLAEALVRAGRPEEALAALDNSGFESPGFHRVRGTALDALGYLSSADESFQVGLEAAIDGNDLYEEALISEARTEARQRAGADPDPADVDRVDRLFKLLGVVVVQPA